MIRASLLKLLWLYQRFFTLLGYGSCRYYPSCSEYAKWQFENNSIPRAFYSSFFRILRCNQLFPGGIDYPVVHRLHCHTTDRKSLESIKYWYVPRTDQRFYIVKNFNYRGSQC